MRRARWRASFWVRVARASASPPSRWTAWSISTAATGIRAFDPSLKPVAFGVSLCDPHSPWQRGGIENANGLLRRDLPRKTRLDGYTGDDIDEIVWNLNSTPRKCLGYKTPIEAFAANLGVALET